MKSRRMRWTGHEGRLEVHTGFWWGNMRQGDHLEDLCVDGRVILKWICNKGRRSWTGLIWLKIWTGDGLLCMR